MVQFFYTSIATSFKTNHQDGGNRHLISCDGYSGKEWKDGKQPLESYLPEILTFFELEADRNNERDKYFRQLREEREEEERLKGGKSRKIGNSLISMIHPGER